MKPAAAIMHFFNKHPGHDLGTRYPHLNVKELREFKNNCDPDEYVELAKQACDIMGEKLEIESAHAKS